MQSNNYLWCSTTFRHPVILACPHSTLTPSSSTYYVFSPFFSLTRPSSHSSTHPSIHPFYLSLLPLSLTHYPNNNFLSLTRCQHSGGIIITSFPRTKPSTTTTTQCDFTIKDGERCIWRARCLVGRVNFLAARAR